MKTCSKCKKKKDMTEFYKDARTSDGLYSGCKKCQGKYATNNLKEFYKNPTPYLAALRAISGAVSRSSPTSWIKRPWYKGVENRLDVALLTSFYEENWDEFLTIFNTWKESGFKRTLAPTLDRIDSRGNYEIGNIQTITHADNTRKSIPLSKRLIHITHNGRTQTLAEWAREVGMPENTLWYRYKSEIPFARALDKKRMRRYSLKNRV